MIQVICCSSLLSAPGRAGAFSRDFTTSFAPECRALSGALKIEKLKAPLIPGPEGAVDTNDWCIMHTMRRKRPLLTGSGPIRAASRQNLSSWIPTRSDTNRAVQPQKLARGLTEDEELS